MGQVDGLQVCMLSSFMSAAVVSSAPCALRMVPSQHHTGRFHHTSSAGSTLRMVP
jgi:hypothetical protein